MIRWELTREFWRWLADRRILAAMREVAGADVVRQHWYLTTNEGVLCVECRVVWLCPAVTDAAGGLSLRRRIDLAWQVVGVHDHRADCDWLCNGCPPGTDWPCRYWELAADVVDGREPFTGTET